MQLLFEHSLRVETTTDKKGSEVSVTVHVVAVSAPTTGASSLRALSVTWAGTAGSCDSEALS